MGSHLGKYIKCPRASGKSGEKEICRVEGDKCVTFPSVTNFCPLPWHLWLTPAGNQATDYPGFCSPSTRQFLGAYSSHNSRSTCQKVSFPSSLNSYTSSAFHWCKHTFFFFFFCLAVPNAHSYVSYVLYVSTRIIAGLVHWSQSQSR